MKWISALCWVWEEWLYLFISFLPSFFTHHTYEYNTQHKNSLYAFSIYTQSSFRNLRDDVKVGEKFPFPTNWKISFSSLFLSPILFTVSSHISHFICCLSKNTNLNRISTSSEVMLAFVRYIWYLLLSFSLNACV
jgi:hypothetical protein